MPHSLAYLSDQLHVHAGVEELVGGAQGVHQGVVLAPALPCAANHILRTVAVLPMEHWHHS